MDAALEHILQQLSDLELKMKQTVDSQMPHIGSLHPSQKESAKNLLHYLSLRQQDIRELQDQLHEFGLSSLSSSEGHILRQVQAIQERLGKKYPKAQISTSTQDYSKHLLKEKNLQLFGTRKEEDIPYIMVTFDSGFADDYALIKSLLQSGMNVARINCAHDNEMVWAKMIQKLKKACLHTGLSCRVYMDLAGPKLRTKLLGKGKEKDKVKVEEGQLIWLADSEKGFDKEDIVISPTESGILPQLKKGERVYIDDGVIRCVIEKVKKDKVGLRITRVSSPKKQIKAEKGINFPDSEIEIPSLTKFDISCLPFIAEHADLIGYSFVRKAEDIQILRSHFTQCAGACPGLILKIETPQAVKQLPALLMEGMKQADFGVMIARGDLAVEIGFERLGEIQEEILWICEAAHTPVIWATQVLESLNKSGMATRSEITDATHAAHAECVMLNKGPHTIEVLETLKDVLRRTASHKTKKRYRFRPLRIAQRYFEDSEKEGYLPFSS